ncbi:glycoside hydrolase family 88 protein [Priestia filamentosa]|uniref:glycoside hydrolase family 88 protein n=1 Tax=Priestia filamentosa TaxID=1402861 RepID=UPI00115E60EC|nr:glycoside hydrolase family 88 protein [Priestia filamentosa]WCM17606.1 hypothetical protein PGN40_09705 [Priestia filamentosa]
MIESLVILDDREGKYAMLLKERQKIDNKSFNYWKWTAGIGLYGMMKYYRLTKAENVLNSIIKRFD